MSYVMMADLLPALRPKQMFFDAPGTGEVALEYAALSGRGRKGGGGMPPPPPPSPGVAPMASGTPGVAPMASGTPPAQLVQEPPPPWFGKAAADAFSPLPPPEVLAASAAPQTSSSAPLALDDYPYVEYVTPRRGLNEATFPSTAALEAGGDLAGGDDDMSDQMVYEGLTGHDAIAQVPDNMADTVDAGGQETFTDVASQPFSLDDGEAGIEETLVEPGQSAQTQVVSRQSAQPPKFTPDGNVNGNYAETHTQEGRRKMPPGTGGTPRNGAQNGTQSRNGAQNGAQNGASIMPAGRNRVRAFEDASRYRQGAGTAARTQETGPPDPASYGWQGMGQTAPAAPRTGIELASQFITSAAPVATAAITRQPPTFTADQQQMQGQQAPTNYTPWLVGAAVLGFVGIAAAIWARQSTATASTATAVVSNPRHPNECSCGAWHVDVGQLRHFAGCQHDPYTYARGHGPVRKTKKRKTKKTKKAKR